MENGLIEKNLMCFPPNGNFEERAVFVRLTDTVVIGFIDHIRIQLHTVDLTLFEMEKDVLIIEDMNRNKQCSGIIIVKASTIVK